MFRPGFSLCRTARRQLQQSTRGASLPIRPNPLPESGKKALGGISPTEIGQSRVPATAALIPGSSKDIRMPTKYTLFRPSKVESKADATTKIVKGIVEADTVARHAKTARLRAARAERDASEAAQKTAAPEKKPRRKSVAKAKPA